MNTMTTSGVTGEVMPVDGRSLDELASDINAGHEQIVSGLSYILRTAISIGHDLRKAQSMITIGEWDPWLQTNTKLGHGAAARYMRLAEFEHLLPAEIMDGQVERQPNGRFQNTATIEKATAYLTSIGARRRAGVRNTVDYDEIRRLRDRGALQREIAELLGISENAVRYALKTPKQRAVHRGKNRQYYRELSAARQREQKRAAIHKTGGNVAEAYALLRRCLQQTQAAHDAMPNSRAKQALKGVMTNLHSAEDGLARACKWGGLDELPGRHS